MIQLKYFYMWRPYVMLLSFFILVYAWRLSGIYWIPAISGHLTNFALTAIAMLLLIGPRDFDQRRRWPKVAIICCLFILANIGVESLTIDGIAGMASTTANTADMSDALFGCMAAVIVIGIYFLRRQLGWIHG